MRQAGRCGATVRPSGSSSPVSSKTTTPLQSSTQPCSGWRETTRAAREAFLARFIREVDPEGVLPEPERLRRAEAARRAYFARLALRSAERRACRRQSHPISTRRSPSPASQRPKAA